MEYVCPFSIPVASRVCCCRRAGVQVGRWYAIVGSFLPRAQHLVDGFSDHSGMLIDRIRRKLAYLIPTLLLSGVHDYYRVVAQRTPCSSIVTKILFSFAKTKP